MEITSWNINSVRAREGLVTSFLERVRPDLLLLQEIKCEAHQFPTMAFSALGYESVVVGQKAYNGVAVLARADVEVTARALPGTDEENPAARYVEVKTNGLRVGNLYLPNGNSGGEAGYAYKLRWMAALRARAQELLARDEDFVMAGDYNVCPTDFDYAKGAIGPDDALVRAPTRAAFRALLNTGLTEAVRALHPAEPLYTFWDYQAGAWDRNCGLRIDHALLSPRLAERLVSAKIHKEERAKTQPSDHVPVSFFLET
ncbi:exodeoxyribonuclease III [Acidocella sp.]|uniref:exodeoxyribonuclease III n=1 Tax=Acidocella sp. TaxID=50710 RepID=UPI00260807AF|nr:exodeoxyribonuclease III [Acidocella sp.]